MTKLSVRKKAGAVVALCAAAVIASSAQTTATTTTWNPGWDNFTEPLNYKTSNVIWSVNSAKSEFKVTFKLRGATPSKLYQIGLQLFCTTFPATFGQFRTDQTTDGNCAQFTRQGVTKTSASVQVGVVTTDIHGNGSFSVVGPIASGTYEVEVEAENGAGCDLTGGAGNGSDCQCDYQSPGPTFGDAITITIP